MTLMKRVIVVGLDGLEPSIVEPMVQSGELPNLAKLRDQGGYARVQTTYPAQTPVAWSTFATGTNPGGHGIFDFIRRDPRTYLPDLSFTRYEQKNAFVPPKAVNLRRGTPVWEILSARGIPSTILRCPCTYPPDSFRGRMLAGMGVPDLRGGLGTPTFYTSAEGVPVKESESVVPVRVANNRVTTQLLGPRNPKTRQHFTCDISVELGPDADNVVLRSDGHPQLIELERGRWSEWLKVKFKIGLLQSVRGMVRFLLVRTSPIFELYASPINFDPQSPFFPISTPPEYSKELAGQLGCFYTTGMVEDHGGLNNGRFDEAAFLAQCDDVLREREEMMRFELNRHLEGLFYCLFDTPDRLQHMFWRFRDRSHPANRDGFSEDFVPVIAEHYRACDAIVGRALEHSDDSTLFLALSDHGFNSFQRGVNLNTWLCDNGLMVLKEGLTPGEEAGDMFRAVDWPRTKAYAVGLSGLYVNMKGREAQGVVPLEDAADLQARIAQALTGLVDAERGQVAIQNAVPSHRLYSGACANESPDVVVNCSSGYRVSWGTALGGMPEGLFEDNPKKWSGDHIIDPDLVPGVLFINRPFDTCGPRLVDMAPTILAALGVPAAATMEGKSLLR